jgi:transcriptional regulator with GAF, ATPase, and Fis domain
MHELEHLHRECVELRALCALAADLFRLEDFDRLLERVVGFSMSHLDADRGFLVLIRDGTMSFKVVRNWLRDELEGAGEPVSRSILLQVLSEGRPLLVEDALQDPRFAEQGSVLDLQIRSVLAAPLPIEPATTAVLYFESRVPERLFDDRKLELFQEIVALSAPALEAGLKRLFLLERTALLERGFLARDRFPQIITQDAEMGKILEIVSQVAGLDLPVLVQGASGTGKELIVRALHLNSRRASMRLVAVNCGAIAPSLLESELFGHEKGAFTGAAKAREGLIPLADGGTLFLDEIGDLPNELQVKLLRTLQFGEVQAVGADRVRHVDVRLVAATNRDLHEAIRQGRFREDLYYRLNAITLQLPSLAERPDDILLLFHHFLTVAAEKAGRAVPAATRQLEQCLRAYPWPGNVRELENEVTRLLALTPPGSPLSRDRLSPRILELSSAETGGLPTLREQERQLIERHLRASGGNRSQAARTLGVTREGLRKMMRRHELT